MITSPPHTRQNKPRSLGLRAFDGFPLLQDEGWVQDSAADRRAAALQQFTVKWLTYHISGTSGDCCWVSSTPSEAGSGLQTKWSLSGFSHQNRKMDLIGANLCVFCLLTFVHSVIFSLSGRVLPFPPCCCCSSSSFFSVPSPYCSLCPFFSSSRFLFFIFLSVPPRCPPSLHLLLPPHPPAAPTPHVHTPFSLFLFLCFAYLDPSTFYVSFFFFLLSLTLFLLFHLLSPAEKNRGVFWL